MGMFWPSTLVVLVTVPYYTVYCEGENRTSAKIDRDPSSRITMKSPFHKSMHR